MNHFVSKRRMASLAACLMMVAAASVAAGECPAGKAGKNMLSGAATAPVGVTDTELAFVDLSKESVKLSERRLRMREMTIAPGGVVPLHSHADRPALIMVVSGEIYEHSSKCSVPILHKAGDVARESMGTMHWWTNQSGAPVRLTIGDIVNDKKPETMKEMM